MQHNRYSTCLERLLNQPGSLGKMVECFSCMSPRLGKGEVRENVFHDDNDIVEDRRDEGEQGAAEDEMREGPSPSNHSTRDFGFQSPINSSDNVEVPLKETESKIISRQEEILRKLGILYLDDKVTRARAHDAETDEVILREAGINLDNVTENDISEREESMKKILNKSSLSGRDAKILKESGVMGLTGFSIAKDYEQSITKKKDLRLETIENKPLPVISSDSTTMASGSINSSYADRKLRRRLRKGWALIGRECMCGMPVIALNGSYECVICGLVEDDTYCDEEEDTAQEVESHMGGGSPGVFLLDSYTDMSTLASVEHSAQEEEALRAELGQRLFSGWVLLGTSCPSCSLPLIGNNGDTPAACVRCG